MKSISIASAFPIQNNCISGVGVNDPIANAKTFVKVVIVIDGPKQWF